MSKIRLTEEEKKLVGIKCCNCGSEKDIEYHHIVPLSFGGNNILSNICCVCYECHSKIHFGKSSGISHSEATKKGIERARLAGKQIGLTKGTKLTTK